MRCAAAFCILAAVGVADAVCATAGCALESSCAEETARNARLYDRGSSRSSPQ